MPAGMFRIFFAASLPRAGAEKACDAAGSLPPSLLQVAAKGRGPAFCPQFFSAEDIEYASTGVQQAEEIFMEYCQRNGFAPERCATQAGDVFGPADSNEDERELNDGICEHLLALSASTLTSAPPESLVAILQDGDADASLDGAPNGLKLVPSTRCNNKTAFWPCPANGSSGVSVLAGAAPLLPLRNASDDALLLARLRAWIDEHALPKSSKMERAFRVLSSLLHVNAWDVLALRETWTEADTSLLMRLDGKNHSFNPAGALTTAAFAARLPSASDFQRVITAPGRVAIVGSGITLRGQGLGTTIDAHASVVRFNTLVGSNLSANETGVRTTVHCITNGIQPQGDPNISVIDLTVAYSAFSYCSRYRTGGKHASNLSTFMMRPSVLCEMSAIVNFTRGFLFYWFIGRLFDGVDMYGFEGVEHLQASKNNINEPFIHFEHLVYKLAAQVNPGRYQVRHTETGAA